MKNERSAISAVKQVSRIIYYAICVFLAQQTDGFADSDRYGFTRLTPKDGLSMGTVSSIVQDSRGFLWIGTMDGLNRYDGYTFTVYKNDPADRNSLCMNSIWSMAADDSGNLWIGTPEGLGSLNTDSGEFRCYPFDAAFPGRSGKVVSLLVGKDRNIWFGIFGTGLCVFDPETEKYNCYPDSPLKTGEKKDRIMKVYEDRAGTIWIGTLRNGLKSFDRESGTFRNYFFPDFEKIGKREKDIRAIYEDQQGNLWIGSGNGLYLFDRNNETFSDSHPKFPSAFPRTGRIRCITEDYSGKIWIGTAEQGVFILDPETGQSENCRHNPRDPRSLGFDNVKYIYEDRSQVMWVGTLAKGLSRTDLKKKAFFLLRPDHSGPDGNQLENHPVSAVCGDKDGMLWIGNKNEGLLRYDPNSRKFQHFQHKKGDKDSLSSNLVWSLLEGHNNTLWIGTLHGGLNALDQNTGKFRRYMSVPDNIRTLYQDRMANLWIGSGLGLSRMNPVNGQTSRFLSSAKRGDKQSPVSHLGISHIIEDGKGYIWIATSGDGLKRFDPKAESFRHYRSDAGNPRSLLSDHLITLFISRSGVLWIGLQEGISRMDRSDGSFVSYTEKQGLNRGQVNAFLEDARGNLWISTAFGISCFTPDTEEFRNYDARDGLQEEYYRNACYQSPDGKMYFGGSEGLTYFDPDAIADNPLPPLPVLTKLLLFNNEVRPGKDSLLQKEIWATEKLNLSYADRIISFEFAATDFSIPDKNLYAYKLEGFEKEWNYTGARRRFATYTNIPPGKYRFRVRGSNNDGMWSKSEAGTDMIITPPWWAEWWFRFLILFLMISSAVMFFRWRIHRLKVREHQLEILVEERTKELLASNRELGNAQQQAESANRAKSEFLAGMSHELRTPLNVILGFSELLKERLTDSAERRFISAVNSAGNILLKLINDVLDLSKIEAGKTEIRNEFFEPSAVFEEMRVLFSAKAEEKKLDFIIAVPQGFPKVICSDELRFRQILINLLSNAFRNTEKGFVRLSATSGTPAENHCCTIRISVEDSGKGIPENQQKNIFQAFVQLENSGTKGGTGLGLSLTAKFAEMLGGSISLSSLPGQGAEFTLLLENVEIAGTDPPAVAGEEKSHSPEDTVFHPATILIAEDIQQNRELFMTWLDLPWMNFLEAGNGKDALALAGHHHPDLILMDMKMPVMSGYEAAERIRSDPLLCDIPIIAVTASALKEDREKIRGLCNAYLPKPVRRAELFRELRRFLPHSSSISELTQQVSDLPAGDENVSTLKTPVTGESPAGTVSLSPEEREKGILSDLPDVPLSEERRADFVSLIRILESDIYELLKERDYFTMEDMASLAEKAADLGKKFSYPPLGQWGDEFGIAVESIDISRIEEMMDTFPEHVRRLKESLANE